MATPAYDRQTGDKLKTGIVTSAALLALFYLAAPLRAEQIAVAEPAVPNTPRAVTPASVARAPDDSPDASRIDASDAPASQSPDGQSPAGADSQVPDTGSLDGQPAAAADGDQKDGVVATVNDEPISDYELAQRTALCVATVACAPPQNEEQRRALRAQILAQLEDEKIRLQEARKKHVTVSPTEVDRPINNLLKENHITLQQLKDALSHGGSSLEALRAEFTAQIAWQKTVQDEYGSDINISQADIDAAMAKAEDGANKTHYLVAEIFLAVENADQDSKVQKQAEDLEKQLQLGAQFSTVAHQFSQNSTAAQGGDLGWVHEGQLPAELNTALAAMKRGEVSQPIRSAGGYYILMLRDRQEPLGTKIVRQADTTIGPDTSLPLARLLLPLGPNPSKELVENALKVAGQVRAAYDGCAKLAEISKQLPGSVYYDMGTMKLSDLSPDLQKALAGTPSGEMAPPVQDDAGLELMGRCDERVEQRTAFTLPTRDEIQNQLFDEQISVLSRRYMRDLKRDADIEERGKSGKV